jgi:translation elongation factor EF-1alpha
MGETEIGRVSHYFNHVGVAAIEITAGELKVGDTIHIKGHTSDFTTTVMSMQIEHEQIQVAKPGDSIGVKVPEHVRQHDHVFLVTPE